MVAMMVDKTASLPILVAATFVMGVALCICQRCCIEGSHMHKWLAAIRMVSRVDSYR
jgi:hypothetical protein